MAPSALGWLVSSAKLTLCFFKSSAELATTSTSAPSMSILQNAGTPYRAKASASVIASTATDAPTDSLCSRLVGEDPMVPSELDCSLPALPAIAMLSAVTFSNL